MDQGYTPRIPTPTIPNSKRTKTIRATRRQTAQQPGLRHKAMQHILLIPMEHILDMLMGLCLEGTAIRSGFVVEKQGGY